MSTADSKNDSGERVVQIRRCACVVKGGRRFSFAALVVTGDGNGRVEGGPTEAQEGEGVKATMRILVAVLPLLLTAAAPPPGDPRIGLLVRQLGADTYNERDAANQALDKIGAPALSQLRQTQWSSPDLEIRRRAEEHGLSPSMLAPRRELAGLLRGERDLALLRGWRAELIGRELLTLAGNA